MTTGSREKLLKALIEIGQELASTTELSDLLDRILHVSREIFGFENAIIRLLDSEGLLLTTAAAYGYPPEVTDPAIRIGQGVMGRVALNRTPVLVQDVTKEPDYVPGIAGARSELAVPMLVRDRLIGVLNVESPRPSAFSEEDIAPLTTLAGQAAIAIDNARLYDNLRNVSARFQSLHHLTERILNSVSLGIYTVDTSLTITAWNRRMAEMSGVEPDVAIGSNLFRLFPSLVEEGFEESLRRVLATGRSEKLKLSHRNLDGEIRFHKRRITPLREREAIVGAVVIIEDTTEFRRLLEQMVQTEKLAEIGRLSAALTHEVNNPLSIIAYAAQLLGHEEQVSEFQREIIDRIAGETERLRGLTGSLLSFSRLQESTLAPVQLDELAAEVLRLLRFELVRKGITLHEELNAVPPIEGDGNRLKQVFINLVMNAVQAMPPRGSLTVRTSLVDNDEVEIAFADTGPGIPGELLPHIFDPFFTTKQEGEGTGLGLYISRHIILEHSGTIAVDSSPGGGTTFRIRIPAA